MDKNKETLETWNKIASLYQDKFMNLNLYNETYDFVCDSILDAKAKILEIGCGPGNITRYLLSKRPYFDIYGIDTAPNMIELAKRNNPTASFKVMDCRQISELKTNYDGIICGFCLPYLSQTEAGKLISDSYNLLTKNGLIYISFIEGDPLKSGFQVASSGDRVYFYYHTLDKVKAQLLDNGFDILKIFKVEYQRSEEVKEVHTIITARKEATT